MGPLSVWKRHWALLRLRLIVNPRPLSWRSVAFRSWQYWLGWILVTSTHVRSITWDYGTWGVKQFALSPEIMEFNSKLILLSSGNIVDLRRRSLTRRDCNTIEYYSDQRYWSSWGNALKINHTMYGNNRECNNNINSGKLRMRHCAKFPW